MAFLDRNLFRSRYPGPVEPNTVNRTLLHWSNAGILGKITGPTLLASTSKWTARALELLEMYGSMLEEEH